MYDDTIMINYTQKMAEVIARYSLDVQPGETVLIRGTSPLAEPLVSALYQEVLRAGGKAFTYIHLSNEDALALESTDNKELLKAVNPMLALMYSTCDCVVRIGASEHPSALSGYPIELQAARGQASNELIATQMRREASGELRRCSTQYPTQGYAQAAGMSLPQYQKFLFEACMLHLDNPVAYWKQVHQEQQRLIDWLDGKKHLEVKGEHINMTMSIEGRTFANASGRVNFPDGEIFTAPVETSVEGWVEFTYPAYYEGNKVEGIKLQFKDGKVVEAGASVNEEFLIRMLDTDVGSRILGEFAIGTNQYIQQFTGSILFDEKIGGTVHMAIGQSYKKTGGLNDSSVHWDMICDMRSGGEILVDGELLYKDGKFVI
jgi:aminopeptidase